MVIPHQRLAPETLVALIESYISREGTDYGVSEVSLQSKVEQLKKQIVAEKVVIVYDEESESINLLTRDELRYVKDIGNVSLPPQVTRVSKVVATRSFITCGKTWRRQDRGSRHTRIGNGKCSRLRTGPLPKGVW